MTAITTAMTPWKHELSQLLGSAEAVVAANPAAVQPIQFAIHQTIRTFEFALADFDTEADTMAGHTYAQLDQWADDIDTSVGDWRRDEWWKS